MCINSQNNGFYTKYCAGKGETSVKNSLKKRPMYGFCMNLLEKRDSIWYTEINVFENYVKGMVI